MINSSKANQKLSLKHVDIVESSDVEKIINLDILVKDFEQELKNVFPKNKELRRKSVLLFRLLLKKQLTQTEIGKTLFWPTTK